MRVCRDCDQPAEVQIHFIYAILKGSSLTAADKVERRDVCFQCFLDRGYWTLHPVTQVDGKPATDGAFLAHKKQPFSGDLETPDALYVERVELAEPDDISTT